MKQTNKTLVSALALLLVAAAIGGAALWATRDEEKKAAQKEKAEKLFELDKAQVRTLRLEKDGKLVAALERKDTAWRIVEPLQAEADDTAANALVDSLSALKQKKDLGDEKDAKPYGFEPPHLAVVAKTADGKESRLEVGADNPFDGTVYARRGGDPTVRMLDANSKAPFEKELFELRDKRVAHLDAAAEIRRIEVSGAKTPFTLEKDGTAWKLVAPAGAADTAAAERVATDLKSLKATAIAAETAPVTAVYGLVPPKITVKLGVGSGKDTLTRTLVFGQPPGGKAFAKRDDSPTVYEVDAQAVKALDKDLFELQDKQLVHAERDAIRKLEIEVPGAAKIEVAREKTQPPDGGAADENFAVLAPQKGPGKKWKLTSVLYSLIGLRASAHEPLPKDDKGFVKLGLDRPRTLSLYGEGGKLLARLKVGGESPAKRRYVVVEGSDHVAEVEKGPIDDLPWKLADVLETPAPAAPDAGVDAGKAPAASTAR